MKKTPAEIKLMGEMNISFGSEAVVKVCKSNNWVFVEQNSVSYDGQLMNMMFMVKIETLNGELERISHNNKERGVRVQYVEYGELTQNRLLCLEGNVEEAQNVCK